MRLGAVFSPTADWEHIIEAARAADDLGYDAIGLWGQYHSARPEWAYICGWSAYGALAALTGRARLVPMVLNNLDTASARTTCRAGWLKLAPRLPSSD